MSLPDILIAAFGVGVCFTLGQDLTRCLMWRIIRRRQNYTVFRG